MNRTLLILGGVSAGAVSLILACGARTGLFLESAAPVDAGFDAPSLDAQGFDGHLLDVVTECNDLPFCNKADPGYVYKCGVRVEQCGSLEQCSNSCGGDAGGIETGDACAASCVNPCRDTLGQNTSNGCEFYAVEMDLTAESHGACYAVFVVNQWQTGQPAKLQVDLGGVTLPIEQFARIPSGTGTNIVYAPFNEAVGLQQNEVAILFLSRDPNATPDGTVPFDPGPLANCPPGVVPALSTDGAIHGTGIGTAFHILSNVPVVAYQMLPYGGGHARVTGATLLLPINVWGTNYIAANAYKVPGTDITDTPLDKSAGPTMAILAQEDGTDVTIDPVAAIVAGGGLAGSPAQAPISYTLNKGQYLQFTQPNELTGSPIQSNLPVAVIGGATLMDVPVTMPFTPRGDSAEQMLPPVSALGSEYVAVRYRSRDPAVNESTMWHIVGAVDGTVLTYDPAPPSGAPSGINHGEYAEITDPGPWVVSSQDSNHPFYFAQYMTAGGYVADAGNVAVYGAGDPEFVNVIAPQQYLPRYTFFTDPTYPETNLVVVGAKDPVTNQFPSVDLDCAGTLTGWQPVGTLGKYQFTRIDLSTGNYQGQNGCNNGVHTIQASLPGPTLDNAAAIGVTIWGWGSSATLPQCGPNDDAAAQLDPNYTCWVSYAYPAGANITKLNNVVVPAN
jgi:hypothetical protein